MSQAEIATRLQDPGLYVNGPQQALSLSARHAQIEDELTFSLERWEALGKRI